MIVVDSSALIAILFDEPERQEFEAVIASGGNRGKSVGIAPFFPCADSTPWILCGMCLRPPSFPR